MLCDEIKQTRQQLGLTQGQLAAHFGVALNTVSRWENGTSKPEGEGMIRLALRQLEQEALLNDGTLMAQIQAKIDLLQKSKEELEELLSEQTGATPQAKKVGRSAATLTEAERKRIRAQQEARWQARRR